MGKDSILVLILDRGAQVEAEVTDAFVGIAVVARGGLKAQRRVERRRMRHLRGDGIEVDRVVTMLASEGERRIRKAVTELVAAELPQHEESFQLADEGIAGQQVVIGHALQRDAACGFIIDQGKQKNPVWRSVAAGKGSYFLLVGGHADVLEAEMVPQVSGIDAEDGTQRGEVCRGFGDADCDCGFHWIT